TACQGQCTISFASGTDWQWSGASSTETGGRAALVCLTSSLPTNCLPDSVIYRTGPAAGWAADTSAAPGAHWVLRGDVQPSAEGALQIAILQKTFALGAKPTGTIQIAADDFAEVLVNGMHVGQIGSVTDIALAAKAQSPLKTMPLDSYLIPGANTITI